jgi:hypothetical protein
MGSCLWAIFAAIVRFAFSLTVSTASAQQQKPNILVIWGDDIGVQNIRAYNHGIMGFRAPNITQVMPVNPVLTALSAYVLALNTASLETST